MPAKSLWCDELDRRAGVEVVQETHAELAARLGPMKNGTLRFTDDYDKVQFSPAAIGNIPIVSSEVLSNGRIELLNYLREQSISETVHRELSMAGLTTTLEYADCCKHDAAVVVEAKTESSVSIELDEM